MTTERVVFGAENISPEVQPIVHGNWDISFNYDFLHDDESLGLDNLIDEPSRIYFLLFFSAFGSFGRLQQSVARALGFDE